MNPQQAIVELKRQCNNLLSITLLLQMLRERYYKSLQKTEAIGSIYIACITEEVGYLILTCNWVLENNFVMQCLWNSVCSHFFTFALMRTGVFSQRHRKDFLIGGAQFLIKLICSTGHIEWAWHKPKTWGGGGTCPRCPPGSYMYSVETLAKFFFSKLKLVSDSLILHLCRSQLRCIAA